MREFLEKLQEDQRRMRKFLRSHALHFKRMGEVLANVRLGGGRVFVIGEPPLDGIATVVAEEYFAFLPALPLRLDRPRPDSVDDESEPPATVREAAARQAARHFHRGDCLVAFLHEADDRETRMVLERARARRVRILIVAGLGAKNAETKRLAKVLLALPTRGIKTVCESCFVCARIMARVARAAFRGSGEDEERLVQISCETCNELVFFEESLRGRRVTCPLCEAKTLVPRSAQRRGERAAALPAAAPLGAPLPGRRRLKPSVMELPTLDSEDLEDSVDDADAEPPEPSSADLPEELEGIELGEPRTRAQKLEGQPSEAHAGLASTAPARPPSWEGPSFGSDIRVGSEVVSVASGDLPGGAGRGERAEAPAEPDPFAYEEAYLAGPKPTDSGEASEASSDQGGELPVSRRVSARFTAEECALRWGRGGFPDETGPVHALVRLDPGGLTFLLNPDDEACGTLQEGDELFVRLEIPAFLEPILVRGLLEDIRGISGKSSCEGARAQLRFQAMDAGVRRKIERAVDNMEAAAT